jgi:hypothetical protein
MQEHRQCQASVGNANAFWHVINHLNDFEVDTPDLNEIVKERRT